MKEDETGNKAPIRVLLEAYVSAVREAQSAVAAIAPGCFGRLVMMAERLRDAFPHVASNEISEDVLATFMKRRAADGAFREEIAIELRLILAILDEEDAVAMAAIIHRCVAQKSLRQEFLQ